MTNAIVTVNVSQQIAPTLNGLQRTGAFISQGGTTLSANSKQLLTSAGDLASILVAALAITSITWSGGTATVTTAVPHGIPNADTENVTIAGAAPVGYNGTFLATSTGASTFTYPLVSNPGTSPASTPGTYQPSDVAELIRMNNTFWAQGSSLPVYVLELGNGTAAEGVTALAAYITANSLAQPFYAYLVPAAWASEATYLTFVAGFEATNAKTYFFTTMSTGNYTSFTALMKSVFGLVPSPTAAAGEFQTAMPFWRFLSNNPSPTNKVPPFAFGFAFGVTPYPLANNGATLAALKAAGVNYIDTGAEGGITNAILKWGTTMDKRDASYWYGVDWLQINLAQAIANEIMNGSNTNVNPLYYDQQGINRLESRCAGVLTSGNQNGIINGAVKQVGLTAAEFTEAVDDGDYAGLAVVNAIPFIPYTTANPSDYPAGAYNGLSAFVVIARGFISIIFNLVVTDFVTQ